MHQVMENFQKIFSQVKIGMLLLFWWTIQMVKTTFIKTEVKLRGQYYIAKSLRNKHSIFRKEPGYLFAAAAYVEKKLLQRNINLTFRIAKSWNSGKHFCFRWFLFGAIFITPSYLKKTKYEMFAGLDISGALQFFLCVCFLFVCVLFFCFVFHHK